MITRRQALRTLAALGLAPACAPPPARTPAAARSPLPPPPAEKVPGVTRIIRVNDTFSRLSSTEIADLVDVKTLPDLHAAIIRGGIEDRPISVSGGGHSAGGQEFATGALHLDMLPARRVLGIDRRGGTVKVEAGLEWPELVAWVAARPEGESLPHWAIRQKQVGVDRVTIGGSLAANAHGRGLDVPPIAADVESFTLVDGAGGFRVCSREENAELFRLVLGGFGLFGVVYSVRLRLVRRRKIRWSVSLRDTKGVIDELERLAGEGAVQGILELDPTNGGSGFLRRGILRTARPVGEDEPLVPAPLVTGPQRVELLRLFHDDPARGFEVRAAIRRAQRGRVEWSDEAQLDDIDVVEHEGAVASGSEVIAGFGLPRGEVEAFLDDARDRLGSAGARVVRGDVRLVGEDRDTFLAWAAAGFASVHFHLHVEHEPSALDAARTLVRGLVDAAIARGGKPLLPYHPWSTPEQLGRAYPKLPAFLREKRRFDPGERFRSEWYGSLRSLAGV